MSVCVVQDWTQHLMQAFKLIAAISERSNRVHVEGILSLTYSRDSLFQPRQVHFLIGPSTVVWGQTHAKYKLTKQTVCWDITYYNYTVVSSNLVQKYSPPNHKRHAFEPDRIFIQPIRFVLFFFIFVQENTAFCIFKMLDIKSKGKNPKSIRAPGYNTTKCGERGWILMQGTRPKWYQWLQLIQVSLL